MNSVPHPQENARKAPCCVLVIDDSEAFRARLKALLEKVEGVDHVCTASSAEMAIARLSTCHPRVILVDVHLGDIVGIELLKMFRCNYPSVRLIALMRYTAPPLADIYYVNGADACYDKTLQMDTILSDVHHVVNGCKQPERAEEKENTDE